MLVFNLPAFENKKYTVDNHFHGNSPYGEILTKKEPIRMLSFTLPYNIKVVYLLILIPFLPAFQEQPLLQAVQSGIVQKIKGALNWLKQLNNSKDIGKGRKRVMKGSKKMGVTDSHGQISEEPTGHVTVISKRVLQLLHQQSTSNQNVLHICCSNPTYVEEPNGIQNAVHSHGKGLNGWFNILTAQHCR